MSLYKLAATPRFPRLFRRLTWAACAALAVCACALHAQSESPSLVANSGFETDANGDLWPDGWPRVDKGGSWETEGGNHFLRLHSTAPGSTVMLYREVPLPPGTEALEITWRQRVSGLKPGARAWFDARIMLGFLNAQRARVAPDPVAPYTRTDTKGWQSRTVRFAVPAGATTLKFMPSLFQVQAGTFDLDDIVIRPIAAGPKPAAPKPPAPKAAAPAPAATTGPIIANGGFETPNGRGDWPASWPRPEIGGTWETEGGNHFLRLTSPEPGKMVLLYLRYAIPGGVKALELDWRQRVTNFKRGAAIWHDARIMIEFLDASGEKVTGPNSKPAPPYTNQNTKGWVARRTQFLVPANAAFVVLMPALFQVEHGTFDLDDLSLTPVGTAALEAAAAARAAAAKARYVPPETPNPSKFPPELHVAGNQLLTPDGREVWLQGVSTSGMETLPNDDQCPKSAVVAIEQWKANVFRLPVTDTFWFGLDSTQKDGGKAYRERVDFIATLVANRGAYLLLDLHHFRAPKAADAAFWKDAAARYKNNPAVLFELFNEPFGVSWDVWRDGGFVADKKQGVDESAFLSDEAKKKNQGFQSVGMKALLAAVRSTGARNIVLVSGLHWSFDLSGIANGYALSDPDGNGVMYVWHVYNWHRGWEKAVLPTAAKYPVLVSEVGADVKKMDFIPKADQEDPYTWAPDMLGFIQQHHLNWTAWCLHPAATPILISDWNYTPTPFWGVFVKEALAGKHFELHRTR